MSDNTEEIDVVSQLGGKLDLIIPAISLGMSQIKKISKENKNEHGNYNFSSIDDFLEQTNKICSDNGLVMMPPNTLSLEPFDKTDKYGNTSSWLKFKYEIIMFHVSGQKLPPVVTEVEVIRSGAQASGSAQSYAQKQYLRALFQIPTGDKDDADFQAPQVGVVSSNKPENKEAESIFQEIKIDLDDKFNDGGLWSDSDLKEHYNTFIEKINILKSLNADDCVSRVNALYNSYKIKIKEQKPKGEDGDKDANF